MLNHFYTYLLLDPRKPGKYPINEHFSLLFEPFYVGYSGREDRLCEHIAEAKVSKKRSRKINKIKAILKKELLPLEFKVFIELSRPNAIDFEIYLIAHIGRIDLGTGILTNGTKGGDGVTGYVYSEEQKKQRSIYSTKNNSQFKEVIIEGIIFKSVKDAASHFNLSGGQFYYRLKFNLLNSSEEEVEEFKRNKLKEGCLGRIPWNKGKKGGNGSKEITIRGETFESYDKACKKLNITYNEIYYMIKNNLLDSNLDEINEIKIKNRRKSKSLRPIKLNGIEYLSINDAARRLGISDYFVKKLLVTEAELGLKRN